MAQEEKKTSTLTEEELTALTVNADENNLSDSSDNETIIVDESDELEVGNESSAGSLEQETATELTNSNNLEGEVEPIEFDEQGFMEEEGNKGEPANLIFPDIPEYANRKEINARHKLMQNALLTPELIKLFDIICQNINLREKNYFNIADFLVSSNFSLVQKEALQNNFLKLVDLLTDKTVDLIKIQERGRNNHAVAISLKNLKSFDLIIFHKFNDFVSKNYNKKNSLRKPLLYQIEQVAENLKLAKEKILPFCISVPIKEINEADLKKLVTEQTEESGKVALLIDLQNEQFGEAIFPFELVNDLLSYLCSQINEYLNNVSNEKVSALIIKKLRDSKIGFTNIKKYFAKPNPHNAEFSAFIRIFYSIISQVYSKNINYSTKKIKETESLLLIALIARQLILNAKLGGEPEKTTPKHLTENMIVRKLLDQTKEVNYQVVRIPVTLNHLMKQAIQVKNQPVYPTRDQLISAFQKLNSDAHTIKEILILRHNATNYYIHRSTIVPLFLNLLVIEKPKIKSSIEEEIRNSRRILKDKNIFEEFINQRVSLVLKLVHECLTRCLMTNKPVAYHDNQSLYWMSRLFLTKDDLVRFEVQNTELDFDYEGKKNTFKNLIKTITHANKDFKNLAEVLGIPYENNSHRASFSLFGFFVGLVKKLLGKGLLKKISQQSKSVLFSTFVQDPNNTTDSTKHSPRDKQERSVQTNKHHTKEPANSKELTKQFLAKIPLLKDPVKLEQKIREEMDNWNLKIGESQRRNQQIIDSIINGCVVRLDNRELANENFDKIFAVIVRNNPAIKKIKNQESLKNYMMFKIMYNKFKRLAK